MSKAEKKRKSKTQDEKPDKTHKKSKKKQRTETAIASPADQPVTIVSMSKSTATNTSSSFSEVVAKIYLHLAPMWANNIMDGVIDQLNAFLMKYVPEVDAVVLAHSNVEFVSKHGKVLYDSPFIHLFVRVKFLVWKPKKGTTIVGRINLQSEDHIGLLIYGTFNASIPRARIPSDKYAWRASEEEAEPFIEAETEAVEQEEGGTAGESSPEKVKGIEERKRKQYGEWIHLETQTAVGGDDGILEFRVEDIIETNDILTVTGSLA